MREGQLFVVMVFQWTKVNNKAQTVKDHSTIHDFFSERAGIRIIFFLNFFQSKKIFQEAELSATALTRIFEEDEDAFFYCDKMAYDTVFRHSSRVFCVIFCVLLV